MRKHYHRKHSAQGMAPRHLDGHGTATCSKSSFDGEAATSVFFGGLNCYAPRLAVALLAQPAGTMNRRSGPGALTAERATYRVRFNDGLHGLQEVRILLFRNAEPLLLR